MAVIERIEIFIRIIRCFLNSSYIFFFAAIHGEFFFFFVFSFFSLFLNSFLSGIKIADGGDLVCPAKKNKRWPLPAVKYSRPRALC